MLISEHRAEEVTAFSPALAFLMGGAGRIVPKLGGKKKQLIFAILLCLPCKNVF